MGFKTDKPPTPAAEGHGNSTDSAEDAFIEEAKRQSGKFRDPECFLVGVGYGMTFKKPAKSIRDEDINKEVDALLMRHSRKPWPAPGWVHKYGDIFRRGWIMGARWTLGRYD